MLVDATGGGYWTQLLVAVCGAVVEVAEVFEEVCKCECDCKGVCKKVYVKGSCKGWVQDGCRCGWKWKCEMTLGDASRAVSFILGGLQLSQVEDIQLVKQSALEWYRTSSPTPHVARRRRVK
jgi:hypothetical protein